MKRGNVETATSEKLIPASNRNPRIILLFKKIIIIPLPDGSQQKISVGERPKAAGALGKIDRDGKGFLGC
ncbi:MAG: hypothetical protein ABIF09_09090 [Gemmatimonadota bacterium]